MDIITRYRLALLTEVESSLLFFGNTTFKYRRGLGKCMEMMDVNGYRLSVVVDCYNMQNVRIKGTEPLINFVKYSCFVMALYWIFYYWTVNYLNTQELLLSRLIVG
jgi:hypothetical protein